jgi:tetrahydromethanopterin S-methyltransferase subunit E
MTVFLSGWITALFDPSKGDSIGWVSVIAGVIIVLSLILWNRSIEVAARAAYGTYKEDEVDVEVAA